MVRQDAFLARETAGVDDNPRTFSEGEHQALVADAVQREIASRDEEIVGLKAQVVTLTAEKAAAGDRADVAEAAKETAERELADYKTGVEQAKAVEDRKDACVTRMREILPDKPDEFFEGRAQAWAEKAPEDFETYAKEMAEVVAGSGSGEGEPPRKETAMRGAPVAKREPAGGATGSFFSHFNTPKGA